MAQRLNAFGIPTISAMYDSCGASASAPANPFGFGGQFGYYTDAETGVVLCQHRYYDSATGRFINRDPIGYRGGLNLYAYCANNPVNSADPFGWLGFSDFTSARNYHACGAGTPVYIPFSPIDTSDVTLAKFPSVGAALNNTTNGVVHINEVEAYETNGTYDKLTVGEILLKLECTLTVKNGKREFDGELKVLPDLYQFHTR